MVAGGVATVNFNPVFIFSTAAFFLCALLSKNRKAKIIAASIFLFLSNYIPLLIFNLRHNNILSFSFANFLTQNAPQQNFFEKLTKVVGEIAVPFYSGFLFHFRNPFLIVLTTALLFLGIILALKSRDRLKQFLVVWIASSVLGFTFYSGHIPDYYFMQTILPFVLLIAPLVQRNFAVLLTFFVLLITTNVLVLVNYNSSLNFGIKKEVVSYVLADTKDQPFNLYYQMPPGLNTGYDYLFKARGRQPQENAKNLYILDFADPQKFDKIKYLKTFKGKQMSFKSIGFVNIVWVKLD